MKNLYESLLDDEDVLMDNTGDKMIVKEIKKFLKCNYKINGNKYVIHKNVVDVYNDIIVTNENIKSLTNGLFKWGTIKGFFDCSLCKNLTSLEGAPKKVEEAFNCATCNNLTSLEGAPEEVGGFFDCSECKNLTSLKGAPKKVGGCFACSDCNNLTSLEGAPKEVGEYFDCERCKNLKSLEGIPKKINNSLFCSHCGKQFTEEEVKKYSNVKGKIYC